jgi:plasmid stability protein
MPTLVLRHVPDDLVKRLDAAAARHRRSLTEEAIICLRIGLEGAPGRPGKPSAEEALAWLEQEVWPLLELDHRTDDEIPGYNARGHFD